MSKREASVMDGGGGKGQGKHEPNRIRITLRQAEQLVKCFGGHDAEMTVSERHADWAQSEDGLYAYLTECPGEGPVFLGATEVDDELARTGRPVAPGAYSAPGASEQDQLHQARLTLIYGSGNDALIEAVKAGKMSIHAALEKAVGAAPLAAEGQQVPEEIDGVNVARLLRNLEETSCNEGASDLACRCADSLTVIKTLLAGTAAEPPAAAYAQPAAAPRSFQQRVQPWLIECFGREIAADRKERNHRFFEEATELVQACGMTEAEAHMLVEYVYGRPIGEKDQEVGGVMVTLAALCIAQGLDMHCNGETELARIWTKVPEIRAKQAGKPKSSPLPEAPAARREDSDPSKSFDLAWLAADAAKQIEHKGLARYWFDQGWTRTPQVGSAAVLQAARTVPEQLTAGIPPQEGDLGQKILEALTASGSLVGMTFFHIDREQVRKPLEALRVGLGAAYEVWKATTPATTAAGGALQWIETKNAGKAGV